MENNVIDVAKNKKINIVKYYINKIVNSELFVIFTAIIIFIKMLFFYKFTIYQADSMEKDIIAKTFLFSMFIVSILFLLKNRSRIIFSNIFNLLLSILMVTDEIYYSYSSSLISVAQISNLKYAEQISSVLGDLICFHQIIYFIDFFVIIILLLTKILKIEKIPKRNFKPIIVYITIMICIYASTVQSYVVEARQYIYNKKNQLEAGTLYAFHILDIETNMNLKKTAKYKTKKEVLNAYNNLEESYKNKYSEDIYNLKDVAKGKNVIILQLESVQDFVIGKTINGKEITPNLNKFLEENIRINNMIIQSYSTTADSEHSAITSLYPLENGMAFAQYSSNKYNDIFDLYKASNYHTVYMHGNDGSFWNRKNVYGLLNIDDLVFIDSFKPDSELINKWVSDEDLYVQAVEKLNKIEDPFFASIVAASSHTGFDLPGLQDKYDKVSIDVGKYKDSYFGNYLEAVNYADYAFGIFIEKLKEENLYDDTVLFVFGDHYGMQMYNEEMLEFIEETDHKYNNVETEINYAKVACGIKIPGLESKKISKTISKLDIKPTLAYISGLNDEFSLGSNIFGTKDCAYIRNGIIITDNYYYNGDWYYRKNGEKIETSSISDEEKQLLDFYLNNMNEELTISNSIVLNNLLK